MSKPNYIAVRKTSWDSLWHAVYTTDRGQETWDRVTEDIALKIARALPPHLPRCSVPLPVRCNRPVAILRESEPGRGESWPAVGEYTAPVIGNFPPEYLADARKELLSDNQGR